MERSGLERAEALGDCDCVGVDEEWRVGDRGSLAGGVVEEEEEVWLEDLLVLLAAGRIGLAAEDRVLLFGREEDDAGLGSGTVFRWGFKYGAC